MLQMTDQCLIYIPMKIYSNTEVRIIHNHNSKKLYNNYTYYFIWLYTLLKNIMVATDMLMTYSLEDVMVQNQCKTKEMKGKYEQIR